MSAKGKIDKSHPNYPEYVQKCYALSEKYSALEDAERAKYPDWKGLDHPAAREIKRLSNERNADLRQLKQEYSYLFTA